MNAVQIVSASCRKEIIDLAIDYLANSIKQKLTLSAEQELRKIFRLEMENIENRLKNLVESEITLRKFKK